MGEHKAESSKPQHPTKPMEDDDEFEEFDVEGGSKACSVRQLGVFVEQTCFSGYRMATRGRRPCQGRALGG